MGSLPIYFEENKGQMDARVRFLARAPGYAMFLMTDQFVLAMAGPRAAALSITFPTVDPPMTPWGVSPLSGRVNYFMGGDLRRWTVGVPTYAGVLYGGIYPGIDLHFYVKDGRLEYDFIVAPGANPQSIVLAFDGAEGLTIDESGDLVATTAAGEVRHHRPVAYQEVSGAIRSVGARYVLERGSRVALTVAAYDPAVPLIIDPVLSYSTYLGGGGNDEGHDIAIDGVGNVYLTGFTTSANFPVAGALQPLRGLVDAFVTKLNPEGTALIYSTYLGGGGRERANGLVVDGSGNAYLTGRTDSTDFPTTSGAFDQTFNGNVDAFVTKLNANGALTYSTYLGGTGFENDQDFDFFARRIGDIDVDGSGNAYVTGATTSTNFPTVNPFQASNGGVNDAFVSKLNAQGSALVWSTYLGGSDHDRAQGIAVDSNGNVYVSGDALSPNFPTTPGAFRPTRPGASMTPS